MSTYAASGQTFTARFVGAFPTGLVGELELELYRADTGASVLGPTTAGITEPREQTYRVEAIAPGEGTYALRLSVTVDGELLAVEDDLIVTADGLAPAEPGGPLLATRAQLERYLRTQGAVGRQAAIDSDLLDDVLAAASARMIGAVPDRTLLPTPALPDDPPVALTFDLVEQRVVQVPDLRELVSATLEGAAVDTPGIVLRRTPGSLCALWVRLPYRRTGALTLTGRWGPAEARAGQPLEVAPHIREACIVWAARAYWQRASRFADNVQDPSGGPVLGYFRNLPPDVKHVLQDLAVPGL